MKCNASPTTCIAADDLRDRLVRGTVTAVMFREVLKPLAAGLGPVGETAIDSVADSIFAVKPPR